MTKGVVITKLDGALHCLEVTGDAEAAIDARITAELESFPDRRSHVILAPEDAAWATYWPPGVSSPAEYPDAFRQSLGGIFAGTLLQKRQRWMDVREKYGPTGDVLTLLRGRVQRNRVRYHQFFHGGVADALDRRSRKYGMGAGGVNAARAALE